MIHSPSASPSLALVATTDGNGDNVYTMNFGLQQGQQGIQGNQGIQGIQGDAADSTIASIAAAAASAASAGLAAGSSTSAAISAANASTNGAIAGAEAGADAGADAAEAVLSGLDVRVTTLETDVDNLQAKTTYISKNGTTTTIAGSGLNVNANLIYTTGILVDIDATNITLSSDLDSEITIGSILNLNTIVTINTRNINIGTNGIGMTAPTLNIGTYNRTATEIRGESIEILASQTTTINGSSNLVLDASTIDIGHSTGDVNISGSTIDIGTTGVLNTINIGNDYSIVNINTGISQYINVDNFFNQLGF
jgi:hypothetical protein